jgi:hypothetical protein
MLCCKPPPRWSLSRLHRCTALTMRQLSASGAPLQSAAFSHFDPVGVACVLYISNLLDPMPELSHPWTEKKSSAVGTA